MGLGLKEAVAMALGGMIGGGIYSAFGIVVAISGTVAWMAFTLDNSFGAKERVEGFRPHPLAGRNPDLALGGGIQLNGR